MRASFCAAMRPEFTTGMTAPVAASAFPKATGSGTRSGSGMNSIPSYPHSTAVRPSSSGVPVSTLTRKPRDRKSGVEAKRQR